MNKYHTALDSSYSSELASLEKYCHLVQLPFKTDELAALLSQKQRLLNDLKRIELSHQTQIQLLDSLSRSPYFDATHPLELLFDLQQIFYTARAHQSPFIQTDAELIEQIFYLLDDVYMGNPKDILTHIENSGVSDGI